MTRADCVHSTPPLNASSYIPMPGRELHPREVLADLLGSGDFPAEVLDPERAAEIIIQRLIDAGFEIVPARSGGGEA